MFELGLGGQHVTTPATGTDGEPSTLAHGVPSMVVSSTEPRPGPVPAGLPRSLPRSCSEPAPRRGLSWVRCEVWVPPHEHRERALSEAPGSSSCTCNNCPLAVCLSWGVCSPAWLCLWEGEVSLADVLLTLANKNPQAVKTRTPQPGSEMMSQHSGREPSRAGLHYGRTRSTTAPPLLCPTLRPDHCGHRPHSPLCLQEGAHVFEFPGAAVNEETPELLLCYNLPHLFVGHHEC